MKLLSFQVFGALASGRPRAKLLYSDYCTHAPQTAMTIGIVLESKCKGVTPLISRLGISLKLLMKKPLKTLASLIGRCYILRAPKLQ